MAIDVAPWAVRALLWMLARSRPLLLSGGCHPCVVPPGAPLLWESCGGLWVYDVLLCFQMSILSATLPERTCLKIVLQKLVMEINKYYATHKTIGLDSFVNLLFKQKMSGIFYR